MSCTFQLTPAVSLLVVGDNGRVMHVHLRADGDPVTFEAIADTAVIVSYLADSPFDSAVLASVLADARRTGERVTRQSGRLLLSGGAGSGDRPKSCCRSLRRMPRRRQRPIPAHLAGYP